MNSDFQTKMKFHIKSTLETLEIEGISDFQVRWEFLKYQIRKISIFQNTKKEKMFLENNLKKLENNTNYIENLEYIDCRIKLDEMYDQKMNGMRIRSKYDCHEYGEKSSIFFLNLELHKAQFEILQKIKKTLHVIKELIKNFLTFIKAYFQKILMCPKMILCNF